jgi:hypothetical protein
MNPTGWKTKNRGNLKINKLTFQLEPERAAAAKR